MRVSALILCASFVVSSMTIGVAQEQQHAHPEFDLQQPPPVTLTFRGRHDITTGRLSGQLELAWVHGSAVSSDTVYLRRPGPGYQLDSILFRGAPFDYRGKSPDSSVLALPLPRHLRPGERGFILMAYSVDAKKSSRHDPFSILRNWLPQVLHSVEPGMRPCEWEPLLSRIYVELAIDSSLRLYTGAPLLNEKEMFGMQPTAAGVYENITADLRAADLSPYKPKFENGIRKYLFQIERGNDCAILLGPDTRIDRIVRDSLTVDVVFPPGRSPLDASLATEQFARMIDGVYERLGKPSLKQLLVTHVPASFPQVGTATVTLDFDESRHERLAADAMLALTRWWQMEESRPESRWLETYTAQHALFALYGENSVRALRAMYQPKVWPKYRRDARPGCLDTTWIEHWEAWMVEGPKRFHAINQLVGDSAFWERVQHPEQFADADTLPDTTGLTLWLDAVEQHWMADTFYTDYAIAAVESKQGANADEWFVEATLTNASSLQLPVDMAVVSIFGDTAMTTVVADETGNVMARSPILNHQPFWVFLDPFHRLPELDRENNRWRLTVPRRPNLTLPSGKPVLGDILFESQ